MATPTGFSQMSGLSHRLSSQRKARSSSLQPVMLRMVDDFLILTPSRAAAEAVILRTMQGAVPSPDCPKAPAPSLHHARPCPALYHARVAAPPSQKTCLVFPGVSFVGTGSSRTKCVPLLQRLITSIPCNACRLP